MLMKTELLTLHVIRRSFVCRCVSLFVVGGWVERMIIQMVFMLLVGVIVRWGEVTNLAVWNAISLMHDNLFALTNIWISVLVSVPLFNNAIVSQGLFYAQALFKYIWVYAIRDADT